jgi:hypothetical protein
MRLSLLTEAEPSYRIVELRPGAKSELADQVDLEKENSNFVVGALTNDDMTRTAVLDGDEVIGAISWSEEPKVFWMHMFGSTKKGAGSMLMKYLAEKARTAKKQIWLNSIAGMEEYYKNLGFRRESSTGQERTFAANPEEVLSKLGS